VALSAGRLQNEPVPVTGSRTLRTGRGGGIKLVSSQHARSQLADRCLAEFREEALRIMQHTCAELSAEPEGRARPSLRARTGWRLVDFGLKLAREPGRHAARQARPAET
jgi:hypothetical protein